MLKNKNKVSKKWLFVSIAVALLAIGTVTTMKVADLGPFANVKKQTSDDGINYNAATEEEKEATEDHKDDLANEDKDDPSKTDDDDKDTPTPEKQKVSPFITIAQQFNDAQYGNRVEVRSYVSGILESTGKCTVTFTKGSAKVTWETSATSDATTTVCDTAMVPREKFSTTGKWSVTVKYTSPKASGISDSRTVDIQ